MPVPKGYGDEYGTIVAAQTARLKRGGKGAHAANEVAKAMADRAISHMQSKSRGCGGKCSGCQHKESCGCGG